MTNYLEMYHDLKAIYRGNSSDTPERRLLKEILLDELRVVNSMFPIAHSSTMLAAKITKAMDIFDQTIELHHKK